MNQLEKKSQKTKKKTAHISPFNQTFFWFISVVGMSIALSNSKKTGKSSDV